VSPRAPTGPLPLESESFKSFESESREEEEDSDKTLVRRTIPSRWVHRAVSNKSRYRRTNFKLTARDECGNRITVTYPRKCLSLYRFRAPQLAGCAAFTDDDGDGDGDGDDDIANCE
jgi:hypothetical protein